MIESFISNHQQARYNLAYGPFPSRVEFLQSRGVKLNSVMKDLPAHIKKYEKMPGTHGRCFLWLAE